MFSDGTRVRIVPFVPEMKEHRGIVVGVTTPIWRGKGERTAMYVVELDAPIVTEGTAVSLLVVHPDGMAPLPDGE